MQTLIDRLRRDLRPDQLLSDLESTRVYSNDAYTTAQQRPALVALPESTEDVVAIVNACRDSGTALVTRGAGTGLSGGATPIDGALLLVTTRMRTMGTRRGLTLWVEPGVRNQAISEAVAADGLYFAPDPSSQVASSIGGNVAENSGGIHCCKYGVTVNNVCAVEVVTSDGEVHQFGSEALDSEGLDCLAAMHASEGLLGVVTRVCVKLRPVPPVQRVIAAAFSDLFVASDAVAQLFSAGIMPAAIEVVDGNLIRAVNTLLDAGFPDDAGGMVLVELDGVEAEVNETIAQARAVLEPLASSLDISRDEAHRLHLWKVRKAAFPAMAMQSPDVLVLDATVPRRAMAPALVAISEAAERAGFRVWNAYHAGDGNLHPSVLFDAAADETDAAHGLGALALQICLDHGGTITGEHGIGIEKVDYMCLQFSQAENAQFHAFKGAFDGTGLLNPGKAIPTPHRCAEGGALHVHDGQFPHPELERF
ncbi:FAD-binding protein [Litorivicinus lipolyticus]|uniref:FAD-binding protein n=1 Tax=Litorivicinus lipolyticus TaxID=418701 RepID=A0A5Q2QA85_9GAMM|nr:FAD-linked oxidase C-terminal domain-containing protein [Litorivicinus lipolyticus]QGG80143.1 FAD-binding protein [Litorivicinus lipolyticus]